MTTSAKVALIHVIIHIISHVSKLPKALSAYYNRVTINRDKYVHFVCQAIINKTTQSATK